MRKKKLIAFLLIIAVAIIAVAVVVILSIPPLDEEERQYLDEYEKFTSIMAEHKDIGKDIEEHAHIEVVIKALNDFSKVNPPELFFEADEKIGEGINALIEGYETLAQINQNIIDRDNKEKLKVVVEDITKANELIAEGEAMILANEDVAKYFAEE